MPTISAARSCAPAAFRRLCVETADYNKSPGNAHAQPPSGGCVLKLGYELKAMPDGTPAAFRRLCVETMPPAGQVSAAAPAAFRRLCVETRRSSATVCGSCQPPSGGCVLKQKLMTFDTFKKSQPPSGGCVLKQPCLFARLLHQASRLQAAVC